MEIGSGSLLGSGSRCCAWVLIAPLVLLCCCCILPFAAAGYFFVSPHKDVRPLPAGPDDLPPVQTVPVIPALPTRTPSPASSLPLLDPEAIPLYGSATLESGFSPDPYSVDVQAGGSVDTAGFSPACGFTSYHPAFVFDWQGSRVPGTFLRIFFTPVDDTATTLLVHTPEGKWLCEESATGSGTGPVLDLPKASSGEYAIWVGAREDGTQAEGSLFISGSTDVAP